MEDGSGIAELESWFCLLVPRAELVARMALRMLFQELADDKRYFARIVALINELDLTREELAALRRDARKLAASLDDLPKASSKIMGEVAE